MQLNSMLSSAKRWWWTLLVATLWAGVVAFFVVSQVPPTYEARARMLVGPLSADRTTLEASQQLVGTYADLVTSEQVLQATIASLDLSLAPERLASAIRPTADATTRLLTIRVQNGDPQRAALIANRLATELQALMGRETIRPEGQLIVVDAAIPNSTPVAPQIPLLVAMAAAASLLGALALVLLIEYFNETVTSGIEASKMTLGQLLGIVTLPRRRKDDSLALLEAAPESSSAAEHRLLAATLRYAGEHPPQSLLLTGADAGARSAEVAANVAAAFAAAGQRVALIDADRQRAEVTSLLELDGRPGVTDLTRAGTVRGDDGTLDSLLVRIASGLRVLPAGRADDAGVAEVEDVQRLVDALLQRVDVIVVHAATAALDPGSLAWARVADATVLVAHRNSTKREELSRLASSARLAGARLAGTVLVESKGVWRWRRDDTAPRVAGAAAPAHATAARNDPA